MSLGNWNRLPRFESSATAISSLLAEATGIMNPVDMLFRSSFSEISS